ncbi:hypothetical protein [Propioniciclava flava]
MTGMLVAFWQSKTVQTFAQATWLNGVVETEPGSLVRIAMVTALFAVTLAVGAGAIIVGYYGWKGYGWARVAGFVALGVGLLTLIGNGWMIASLFPLALAVAALWLPVSRAYCDAWHVRRHPVVVALPDQGPIHYGSAPPLSRMSNTLLSALGRMLGDTLRAGLDSWARGAGKYPTRRRRPTSRAPRPAGPRHAAADRRVQRLPRRLPGDPSGQLCAGAGQRPRSGGSGVDVGVLRRGSQPRQGPARPADRARRLLAAGLAVDQRRS